MYLIIFISSSLLISYLIWYFSDYKVSKYGCCGKIKFNQYLKFKEIAPEKWYEWDGWVSYDLGWCSSRSLYFSQIDYIRYMIYKKRNDKKQVMRAHNSDMEAVLKNIQKDIDKYRKDHPPVWEEWRNMDN